jgi:hypothetical protein
MTLVTVVLVPGFRGDHGRLAFGHLAALGITGNQ